MQLTFRLHCAYGSVIAQSECVPSHSLDDVNAGLNAIWYRFGQQLMSSANATQHYLPLHRIIDCCSFMIALCFWKGGLA